jgi:phosphoglycerate dehydrogenase-like enzyme
VAEATVGLMIALSHNMLTKDRLVREAKWYETSCYMGCELRDRTLGVVGLGAIARKLLELLSGWGMRTPLAYDPHIDPAVAAKLGAELVGLDELMSTSDFVSIHCPLTPTTRGMIGRREIGMMRPDAYLINTARGGIVDEDALHDALRHQRIAGAAMDCFAGEPLTEPSRFREFENMLHAPHGIAWTHEMFRDIGRTACQAIVDLSQHRRPWPIVNPGVLEQSGFQRKWKRICDEQA